MKNYAVVVLMKFRKMVMFNSSVLVKKRVNKMKRKRKKENCTNIKYNKVVKVI